MISADELRQLVKYDRDTGLFQRGGKVIGTRNKTGYVVFSLKSTLYYAHRLAWLYETGEMPSQIDHVNGIKNDNRMDNLRLATHAENMRNRVVRPQSTSGRKGVRLHKTSGLWFASIVVDRKVISLGYHRDKEDAASAYDQAAIELHGDFARTNAEAMQ
jgi:hypothetical protein